eukprot:254156_1
MESLVTVAKAAVDAGVVVCFEPTSVPKARIAGQNKDFLKCLTFAYPNLDELYAMADGKESKMDVRQAAVRVLNQMNDDISFLVITLGAEGVFLASMVGERGVAKFQHFPTEEIDVANCTGAGDTLAGSLINSLLNGSTVEEGVQRGMEHAKLSLRCGSRAISQQIK